MIGFIIRKVVACYEKLLFYDRVLYFETIVVLISRISNLAAAEP